MLRINKDRELTGIFYDEGGRPFLTRCPDCGNENYGPAVATGMCCWCGFDARTTKEEESLD